MINDNLTRQIKNWALHTCRLFLLTWNFNILAIGQKYLNFYPPTIFNIGKLLSFFSWLCRFIYKLGCLFFIYHLWYTSNYEYTCKKPSFIKVAIFFWCNFSIISNYHDCIGQIIKLIPYVIDVIYKNCKANAFEKRTNHTKYK